MSAPKKSTQKKAWYDPAPKLGRNVPLPVIRPVSASTLTDAFWRDCQRSVRSSSTSGCGAAAGKVNRYSAVFCATVISAATPVDSRTEKRPGSAATLSLSYGAFLSPMRKRQLFTSPSSGHTCGNSGKLPRLGFPPVPESCTELKPVTLLPSVAKPPVFAPSTSATALARP